LYLSSAESLASVCGLWPVAILGLFIYDWGGGGTYSPLLCSSYRSQILDYYVAYGQCANGVTVYVQHLTHLTMVLARPKHVV
jgi:hypothetical protein